MAQNFAAPRENWLIDGALVLATIPPYPPWPAIILDDPITKKWYRYDGKKQMEVYILYLEWWDQNSITDSWMKASSIEQYKGEMKAGHKKVLKRDMIDLQKAIKFANQLMELSSRDRKNAVEAKYEKPPESSMLFNGALVLATYPSYPPWPSIISEDPDSGKWWKYIGKGKLKYEVYVIFLEWYHEGKVTFDWIKSSTLRVYEGTEKKGAKKASKKFEDDLKKAFSFAKTLNTLPYKTRLKKAYLKYGLNPVSDASTKQGISESIPSSEQTKRRTRKVKDEPVTSCACRFKEKEIKKQNKLKQKRQEELIQPLDKTNGITDDKEEKVDGEYKHLEKQEQQVQQELCTSMDKTDEILDMEHNIEKEKEGKTNEQYLEQQEQQVQQEVNPSYENDDSTFDMNDDIESDEEEKNGEEQEQLEQQAQQQLNQPLDKMDNVTEEDKLDKEQAYMEQQEQQVQQEEYTSMNKIDTTLDTECNIEEEEENKPEEEYEYLEQREQQVQQELSTSFGKTDLDCNSREEKRQETLTEEEQQVQQELYTATDKTEKYCDMDSHIGNETYRIEEEPEHLEHLEQHDQQVQQELNQEQHSSFYQTDNMWQEEDKIEGEQEESGQWEQQELHTSSDNSDRTLDMEANIEEDEENYVEEDGENCEKELEEHYTSSNTTSDTPEIEDIDGEEEEDEIEEDGEKIHDEHEHLCTSSSNNHMTLDIRENNEEEEEGEIEEYGDNTDEEQEQHCTTLDSTDKYLDTVDNIDDEEENKIDRDGSISEEEEEQHWASSDKTDMNQYIEGNTEEEEDGVIAEEEQEQHCRMFDNNYRNTDIEDNSREEEERIYEDGDKTVEEEEQHHTTWNNTDNLDRGILQTKRSKRRLRKEPCFKETKNKNKNGKIGKELINKRTFLEKLKHQVLQELSQKENPSGEYKQPGQLELHELDALSENFNKTLDMEDSFENEEIDNIEKHEDKAEEGQEHHPTSSGNTKKTLDITREEYDMINSTIIIRDDSDSEEDPSLNHKSKAIQVDTNTIVTEQTQIYEHRSHELSSELDPESSNRSIYVEHSYGVLNNEYVVEESYIDLQPRHEVIDLDSTSTQELNEIEESDRNAVLEYIEYCREEELKKENERLARVETYECISEAEENDLQPQTPTETSDTDSSIVCMEDKYEQPIISLKKMPPEKSYFSSKSESDNDAISDNTQNEVFEIEKERAISSFKRPQKRVTDLVEDERLERDDQTSDSDLCNENYVAKCADKIMRLENCGSSDSDPYQEDQIENTQNKVFRNKGERKFICPPNEDRLFKVKVLKQKYLKMKNKKLEMKQKRKFKKGKNKANSGSEHNMNGEGEGTIKEKSTKASKKMKIGKNIRHRSRKPSDNESDDDMNKKRPVGRPPKRIKLKHSESLSDSDDDNNKNCPVGRPPKQLNLKNTESSSDSDDEINKKRSVGRPPKNIKLKNSESSCDSDDLSNKKRSIGRPPKRLKLRNADSSSDSDDGSNNKHPAGRPPKGIKLKKAVTSSESDPNPDDESEDELDKVFKIEKERFFVRKESGRARRSLKSINYCEDPGIDPDDPEPVSENN